MENETEKKWTRPTAKEGSSNMWKYFELELPEKKRVRCTKCPFNTKFFKYTGSTHAMWYHLERVHHIHKSSLQRKATPAKTPSRAQESSSSSKNSNTQRKSQIESGTATSAATVANASTSNAELGESPESNQKGTFSLKQMSLAESFGRNKSEPRDKIYARMSALHHISFKTLAESYDVHQRVIKEGHKPYLHHKSVARELM